MHELHHHMSHSMIPWVWQTVNIADYDRMHCNQALDMPKPWSSLYMPEALHI